MEIAGGLLGANAGDALNTLLMSVFLVTLVREKYLLALLPVLAALRGGVMTSMASRVTSRLYLGLYPPRAREILRSETGRTVSLALLSAAFGGLVISAISRSPAREALPTAVISSLIAIGALLPLTVIIVVVGFRRNLNPDNYVAPILTVLGDASTVPSLVIAAVFVGHGRLADSILTVLALYFSLKVAFAVALSRPEDRRILGESLLGLLVVGMLESLTGGFYARYTDLLLSLTILHLVPSMMEDVGAAVSVFTSRTTTLSHLHGFPGALARAPVVAAEVLVASTPAITVLSTIGYMTGRIAYGHIEFLPLIKAVSITWVGLFLLLAPVALMLSWAATRLGFDPDNIVLPIMTSIVDVSLIPFIALIAGVIA
ncbi:MAG: magnesium transporter [Desulfurococcales archaeon]|nr:magnesium transporter [Desulfurococcales archaeon]